MDGLAKQLSTLIDNVPDALLLAVIAVGFIVTGYFLELVSMPFVGIEGSNFKRHLGQNNEWVRQFFANEDLADEYDEFVGTRRTFRNVLKRKLSRDYNQLQEGLLSHLRNTAGTGSASVAQETQMAERSRDRCSSRDTRCGRCVHAGVCEPDPRELRLAFHSHFGVHPILSDAESIACTLYAFANVLRTVRGCSNYYS